MAKTDPKERELTQEELKTVSALGSQIQSALLRLDSKKSQKDK